MSSIMAQIERYDMAFATIFITYVLNFPTSIILSDA